MPFVALSEKTPSRRLARTVVAGSITTLALFTSGCGLISPLVEAPNTQSDLNNIKLSVVKLENTQNESFNKLQYSVTELQNQMEATRKADAERTQNLESIQSQLDAIRKDLANSNRAAVAAQPAAPDKTVEQENVLKRAAQAAATPNSIPEAINLYRGFLTDYADSPKAPNAAYELGCCYFKSKDYQKGLEAFQSVLDTYPQSPIVGDSMLSMALCQYQLNKIPEARETVKNLETQFPKYANDDTLKKLKGELAKVK
ncbi:MAG TPA: tetratricopeptide repeat protein [Candidatus Sumerlaeota bacterium]|nr:tetratricopeptide repeat protein [Candidatus Sumerlaeota bacterium]HPS03029.1 tetratricopeptide repeat protein [Candidatus Sumerlaeota bacterium]